MDFCEMGIEDIAWYCFVISWCVSFVLFTWHNLGVIHEQYYVTSTGYTIVFFVLLFMIKIFKLFEEDS
jgi:hypothetical protein